MVPRTGLCDGGKGSRATTMATEKKLMIPHRLSLQFTSPPSSRMIMGGDKLATYLARRLMTAAALASLINNAKDRKTATE